MPAKRNPTVDSEDERKEVESWEDARAAVGEILDRAQDDLKIRPLQILKVEVIEEIDKLDDDQQGKRIHSFVAIQLVAESLQRPNPSPEDLLRVVLFGDLKPPKMRMVSSRKKGR
jgi:hypothetical protein